MSAPTIKIIALSNVFCRMMHFEKKGDVEAGHKHNYDHATLVSTGSVLVECLDDKEKVLTSKIFQAPNMIFIDKEKQHRITSLEDGTVCCCIHALRTIDEEIIDPDFLIEPLIWDNVGKMNEVVEKKLDKKMKHFSRLKHVYPPTTKF